MNRKRKAYLGISKSKRENFSKEIQILKTYLESEGIELRVFVDQYEFSPEAETEMMQTAFAEIDKADMLIVELSHKAIGVGVETGYAAAKNIPIIYLKREAAPNSTTVGGCSDFKISYLNEIDLLEKLKPAIQQLKHSQDGIRRSL